MAFDKKLLEVVACPICKGKLVYQAEAKQLICRFDRLAFPIKENIPVLIESEADSLTLEQIEALTND
ncbi:MAG: Trm112 family protein [Alteromonas sp.]